MNHATVITLTPRIKLLIVTAVLAVMALLLAVGCGLGKITEPFRDAPVSSVNQDAAVEVTMPDGFSNLATKCIAPGIRVASAYHGDANRTAIALVADPNCR